MPRSTRRQAPDRALDRIVGGFHRRGSPLLAAHELAFQRIAPNDPSPPYSRGWQLFAANCGANSVLREVQQQREIRDRQDGR
jgi:hypothetical protein